MHLHGWGHSRVTELFPFINPLLPFLLCMLNPPPPQSKKRDFFLSTEAIFWSIYWGFPVQQIPFKITLKKKPTFQDHYMKHTLFSLLRPFCYTIIRVSL